MRIELDTAANVATFDGVRVNLDILCQLLTHPDPRSFFQFERRRDDVVITEHRTEPAS